MTVDGPLQYAPTRLRRLPRWRASCGPSAGSGSSFELDAVTLARLPVWDDPISDYRPRWSTPASTWAGQHPAFDLVADGPDGVDALAGGVVELPVLVALAGEERAGVAAAHGDDDVGGPDDLVGPGLGVLAGDVDADLGHGRDGGRVDRSAGFGAAGPGDGAVAGEVVEPAEGHLRAAGVVDAEEQHGRSRSALRTGLRQASARGARRSVSAAGRVGKGTAPAPRRPAPRPTWATTNTGTDDGRMPAKVSVRVRATVTAGLANVVDDVNQ